MSKLESTLVGVAGEYMVAGELSRRNCIASITLRNSRGIDIIASNNDGTKSISIQVKTNNYGAKNWLLNQKAETFASESHFYAFVILRGQLERPEFHIVPSPVVAETVTREYAEWLNKPGRNGRPHKPTSMRKFHDNDDVYLERWDFLPIWKAGK